MVIAFALGGCMGVILLEAYSHEPFGHIQMLMLKNTATLSNYKIPKEMLKPTSRVFMQNTEIGEFVFSNLYQAIKWDTQ